MINNYTTNTCQLTGSAGFLSTGGGAGAGVGSGPWWNSRCSFPEFKSAMNCFTSPGLLSLQSHQYSQWTHNFTNITTTCAVQQLWQHATYTYSCIFTATHSNPITQHIDGTQNNAAMTLCVSYKSLPITHVVIYHINLTIV